MFSVELWTNLADRDNFIESLTGKFKKWKHSTRSEGGSWFGEGEFVDSPKSMELFFLENIGLRIKVVGGGITWWEGQIVRMEFSHKGMQFQRSMEKLSNKVKIIYSKIGDNLITNGDVESGIWTKYGNPSTFETTTAWYAKGPTAMHIISANNGQGAEPHPTAITISASTAYDCGMIVDVNSGPWTLQVDNNGPEILGSVSTSGSGRHWLQCSIPATNDYTNARVRLFSSAADQEVYADGAVLYTSPQKVETEWFVDADSVTKYGTKEGAFLEREMGDAEATAVAQRELVEKAWTRTEPVGRGRSAGYYEMPGVRVRDRRYGQAKDKLMITCMGMNWTLGWKYALTEGTSTAADLIASLIDESEFISSSDATIDANTAELYLDTVNPTTLWRQIEKVLDVGDGAGATWMAGTYPGREFRFEARPSNTVYQFARGEMRNVGGGSVVPLEFMPGWCTMIDMPAEPTPAGATEEDDPRRVWLDETWFVFDKGVTRVDWNKKKEK